MDKKERALQLTRDLILKKGIQGASMAKVSETTKIPVGTLYNLFHSKEELIGAVYLYCRNILILSEQTDFSGMSFKEALQYNMHNYITQALKHPQDYLFVQQYHLSPVIKDEWRLDANQTMASTPIATAAQNGIIKELTPNMVASIILGITNQALNQHISGSDPLTEKEISQLLDAAWDAIKAQ